MPQIQIDVLFFAGYRELAGSDQRNVSIAAGSSAGALVASLRAQGGGLAEIPRTAAVVVNQRVVSADHPIHEGDEVALLPPVAGG